MTLMGFQLTIFRHAFRIVNRYTTGTGVETGITITAPPDLFGLFFFFFFFS